MALFFAAAADETQYLDAVPFLKQALGKRCLIENLEVQFNRHALCPDLQIL
jgi:hypothetical protein